MGNVSSSSPSPVRPAVVTRGTVAQRPWAATLAAMGLGGRSGQLTLSSSAGKSYRIAFAHGIVVGATSPIAADSVSRIALAHRMISATQAQQIARALGKAGADDVDRFAEATGLPAAQIQLLKRRVIIQRAARTFDVEAGEYHVDDKVTIPVLLGVEVDIRAAIYFGARKHEAQERLTTDLRQLGTRFVLRTDVRGDLGRFDLGEAEQPVIEALREGTSVPELEAAHRELDPRMTLAVLVSLAACDAITQATLLTRVPTPQDASVARTPTPREPTVTRVPTPREPMVSCVPEPVRDDPEIAPARTPRFTRPPSVPRAVTYRAFTDPFLEVQSTTQRPSPLSFAQVKRLIASRSALLGTDCDHFEFLGIPFDAPVSEVRAAYLEMARYLRPERLKELGIVDTSHDARSVFAQVVIAYTVLTDPVRRAEYLATLARRPRR